MELNVAPAGGGGRQWEEEQPELGLCSATASASDTAGLALASAPPSPDGSVCQTTAVVSALIHLED